MKAKIILRTRTLPGLSLESIDETHLELLRQWRNANRNRFFYQGAVTPASQMEWYAGYCKRAVDWIFVVRADGAIAGCVGYRLVDGAANLHTLLRDESFERPSPVMSHAFDVITNYISQVHGIRIIGQVLAENPALPWFQRRGFLLVGQGLHAGLPYIDIEQDPAQRIKHEVIVETSGACFP
jgi:hypothetical protein